MSDKKKRLLSPQQVAIGMAIAILGLLYVSFVFITNCRLQGREFSPELFQERSFTYWRAPGTRIRLSATSLSTPISPCSKYILSTLPTSTPSVTWKVIEASQGKNTYLHGPAILLKYLESKNANGHNYWDDWSYHNPEFAKVMWPIVQQAAMQDLYFCIPDLMRAAENSRTTEELHKTLKLVCLRAAGHRAAASQGINSPATPFSYGSWAKGFASDILDEPEVTEIIASLR
ncbi:MAG: hypothetical protein ABL921_25470 [Pirellula sp.]